MFLIIPSIYNNISLLEGEIYGPWTNPILVKDYILFFHRDIDYYGYKIDNNDSFTYKIKLNNEEILVDTFVIENKIYKNSNISITEAEINDYIYLWITINNEETEIIVTKEYIGEFRTKNYILTANGKGIFYYENGQKRYEGDIINNNIHGKGITFYNNGTKEYEGYFENNERRGKGKLYLYNKNGYIEGTFN